MGPFINYGMGQQAWEWVSSIVGPYLGVNNFLPHKMFFIYLTELHPGHRISSLNHEQRETARFWTSINPVTFSIKRVGKLKLQYPLLFINIHKGTKQPITVHQNLQPAYIVNRNGCFRGHNRVEIYTKTGANVYGNTHISKVKHNETTFQLLRPSRRNIIICCLEKMCIYKINGPEIRAK